MSIQDSMGHHHSESVNYVAHVCISVHKAEKEDFLLRSTGNLSVYHQRSKLKI